MATTYSSYRLRAAASIKFLATQNMPSHFLANVYYGQMAGWIKIPLGTEVGLGQATVCWMGTHLPTKMAQQPLPTFRPMSIMEKLPDGLGYHLVRR